MSVVLRSLMVLGILLILFSMVTGMGSDKGPKPAHSQYLMTGGLVSLGLWVVGGLLQNFFTKPPSDEIAAKLAAEHAAKDAEKSEPEGT